MRARANQPLTLALALAIADGALAQEARSPAAPGEIAPQPEPRGDWIEEITITAERRLIDAQELGVSVSAFSAEALEAQNIQEIHDLQFKVPSFVATGGASQITVRGMGTDVITPAGDPGFGLHLDGVYVTPGIALLDYFDVERIEVLPGPQGSLGGRHTTGGSIYIWTKRPAPEWELAGDVEVASYEKFRVRAVANAPLSETLAARVALVHENPAFPLKAEPVGQRYTLNDLDGGAQVRASLRWQPTEALVVDVIGSRSYIATSGAMWRYFGDYPAYCARPRARRIACPRGRSAARPRTRTRDDAARLDAHGAGPGPRTRPNPRHATLPRADRADGPHAPSGEVRRVRARAKARSGGQRRRGYAVSARCKEPRAARSHLTPRAHSRADAAAFAASLPTAHRTVCPAIRAASSRSQRCCRPTRLPYEVSRS
jgi:outer membrane receptor protein involved in Fe transport